MNNDFSKYVSKFLDIYSKDDNGRYKSYDHCRKCFLENKNDKEKYDLIALNLYAYLASWGMLRNSFLMQKDYKFQIGIVKILCKSDYNRLLEFDPFEENNENDISLLMKLKKEIVAYYKDQTFYLDGSNSKLKIENVTDTLVTKIILGTFGCVVAYDQYVVKALRINKICGTFNEKSVAGLIQFAKKNKVEITFFCDKLGKLYTPMKIVDMYFFEAGFKE